MLGSLEGPAILGVAVLPNDSVTFAATRAVRVGYGGNVNVQFAIAQTLQPGDVSANNVYRTTIIPNVQDGETLAIRVNKIFLSGTTANGFTALY